MSNMLILCVTKGWTGHFRKGRWPQVGHGAQDACHWSGRMGLVLHSVLQELKLRTEPRRKVSLMALTISSHNVHNIHFRASVGNDFLQPSHS